MSAPRILVRKQADEEIDEIARYIARRNLDAGKGFYDAVQAAFERLAAMPGSGTRRAVKNPSLRGLRSSPITGYDNFIVFFLPLADGGIDVIHVLHGMRDYWKILEE